ncbi:uncharacterized protein A1O9_00414 [Exophiala aquamarina CBS 119918]|uniref:Peroxin/Ferlin domain-containing protein n=1 Tax=Exophiala aquamarina CBS 119918 TaxID=1182545 RepID=A0A072PRR0_9EURO|nr:uncharacterized protein A1O9_00414 [Exophiala aquamarina CBS 119918]KEF62442.1 hypothetical protein A1O9_00414 [Exophiala aquamarina CBS 119918]
MSVNVNQTTTRVATLDGASDPYDHEISLIDATRSSNQEEQRSASPSPSWRHLAKKPTRNSLKDHLQRRRYAKWQEDRQSSKPSSIATEEDRPSNSATNPTPVVDEPELDTPRATHTFDFAPDEPTERGRQRPTQKGPRSKHHKDRVYEYDILYENQRGAFFCGIPLYSHSSLMPIDPSPWVNKDFKDSPVNITNAQVPDPSWEWTWKSWYVDMSHDVDEEGWQYSFAFGGKFAWHGTHPWFHSFVRQRRWLRKRAKKDHDHGTRKPGSLGAAHNLTGDYFTIHSKRDRSPMSAVDGPGKTARPTSYLSYQSTLEIDEPPEDVKDIASLLKALRFATIDREKIEVVKKFVDQGGEELAYLKDHIHDIMSFLVFQNSRRQLLSFLKESAVGARQHRQKHEDEQKPENDAESRRIDNILAAVDAANAQIAGLEYWSDRKDILKTVDDDSMATQAIATIFDKPGPKPIPEDDPVKEIKGISADAEIKAEKSPMRVKLSQHRTQAEGGEEEPDKGKARVHDSEDDQVEDNSELRLGVDQVLIPDED